MDKICPACGARNDAAVTACVNCGEAFERETIPEGVEAVEVGGERDSQGQTLYLVAEILNWVFYAFLSVVTFGVGLIAGAWIIPMTIVTHRARKDKKKHIALGVCTLLFINLISGILILVAGGEDN